MDRYTRYERLLSNQGVVTVALKRLASCGIRAGVSRDGRTLLIRDPRHPDIDVYPTTENWRVSREWHRVLPPMPRHKTLRTLVTWYQEAHVDRCPEVPGTPVTASLNRYAFPHPNAHNIQIELERTARDNSALDDMLRDRDEQLAEVITMLRKIAEVVDYEMPAANKVSQIRNLIQGAQPSDHANTVDDRDRKLQSQDSRRDRRVGQAPPDELVKPDDGDSGPLAPKEPHP